MSSENAMDNGYDSDGQLGLFIQEGVSNETNFCMDEAPIQGESALNIDATKTTETVDKSVVQEAVVALNGETIDKMKVVDLRKELGRCAA